MAKELTQEEKVKVIGLYPKCPLRIIDGDVPDCVEGIDYIQSAVISERINMKPGEVILSLIPLSKINGNDAIEVAKISGYEGKKNMVQIGKEVVQDLLGNLQEYRSKNQFAITQYLLSKYYAIPLFFGIEHWANGKTAIELKIAVEKN